MSTSRQIQMLLLLKESFLAPAVSYPSLPVPVQPFHRSNQREAQHHYEMKLLRHLRQIVPVAWYIQWCTGNFLGHNAGKIVLRYPSAGNAASVSGSGHRPNVWMSGKTKLVDLQPTSHNSSCCSQLLRRLLGASRTVQEYWMEQARRALDIHALPAYAGLRVDKGTNSENGRAVHMQGCGPSLLICTHPAVSLLFWPNGLPFQFDWSTFTVGSAHCVMYHIAWHTDPLYVGWQALAGCRVDFAVE